MLIAIYEKMMGVSLDFACCVAAVMIAQHRQALLQCKNFTEVQVLLSKVGDREECGFSIF
jgi:hypothetical protein